MRYFVPLVLLLLALAAPLSAQRPVGSLRGELTDARSGEPLVGASVLLVNTTTGAATDVEGVFLIANIPAGVYSVRFQSLGYEPYIVADVIINLVPHLPNV
jgi:iron complex outermembrane receptor protein